MATNFPKAFKIFFEPDTIAPFLIGSVCLSIFGSAIYDMLKDFFGGGTAELARIAIVVLVVIGVSVWLVSLNVSRKLAFLSNPIPQGIKCRPLRQQYRGLILLVSRDEPCREAILFHLPRLERCWLICSPQSIAEAEKVSESFPTVCQDALIVVNDVYDPIAFRDYVNQIYATLPDGWSEGEVIADYVGMTAHASVGMVLACVGKQRPLQYTPAINTRDGKLIGSMEPIEVNLG